MEANTLAKLELIASMDGENMLGKTMQTSQNISENGKMVAVMGMVLILDSSGNGMLSETRFIFQIKLEKVSGKMGHT